MGQATEKSQGADIDFRVRPNVLMDFAQTWAERHGHHGGFSITRLSEKIKTRVVADLMSGHAISSQLRDGKPIKVVDLSDDLSGFVYYAMIENNNGLNELVTIVDVAEFEEIAGVRGGADPQEPVSLPQKNGISPVDKMEKNDVGADELVLLRYCKEMSDELPHGEVLTTEVKRGELQGMILKLLADGVAIDSMMVWSNGRRPQIDVKL